MVLIKKWVFALIITLLLGTLNGCVFDEEEPFVCDKNAVAKIGGEKHCAFARVERHSMENTESSVYESIEIGFSLPTTNFKLTLYTQGSLLQEGKTYTNDTGASYWFPEISQSFHTSFTITKLNRENQTISGKFSYIGEGASNYQAYDYNSEGKFEDITYDL